MKLFKKSVALLSALVLCLLVGCGDSTADISSAQSSNKSSAYSSDLSSKEVSSAILSDSFSSATSSNPTSSAESSQNVSSKPTSSIPAITPPNTEGKKFELTFFDDFLGTTLDSKKWDRCPEWNRGDRGGKWDDDMAVLDGKGNLLIKVGLDSNGNPISGAVRTRTKRERNLFSQARGYFEIRCKLQTAPGCWGAFWLMGSNGVSKVGNGAVDGAEIDIFESFDAKNGKINHAIHWDGYEEHHKSTGSETINKSLYDDNYHTFGMLWNEDGYYFYVDRILVKKIDNTQSNFPGSSNDPSYLKITAEFGSWGGQIKKDTLPDALVVDYVKVYKEVK